MKNKIFKNIALLFFIAVSAQTNYAQYSISSSYLIEPELIKGHVDSCAKFWLPTIDNQNGGFYENVSRNGTMSGTTKTMLGQSRTAYGMVKAFMLSGDTNYLGFARNALNFMYEHAWDDEHMGWFNEFYEDGSLRPGGHNDDKWSFMQHYALLGIAAMVEATDTEIDKEYLELGRNAVDSLLWDSRPEYLGYFNEADLDWSNPQGKGFTPTADAITTHGLSMYLLNQNQDSKEKLLTLANNLNDYLVGNMNKFQYGFPESYNNDWIPNLNDTFVFTGHLLKAAWCMTRAYLVEENDALLVGSTTLLNHVLEKGYDNTYGGCFSNYNGSTGSRYNANKEWWQLEQAFTASIMNYYISKEDKFLQMADETINFYMRHFVDREYGEVYTSTKRDGGFNETNKASYWKAGYHSIELGYYVYLYTNLYIHENSVDLFYNFLPVNYEREIKLTPLAIEDEKLEIKSVLLDGVVYSGFDASSRTLIIPNDIGGVFEVEFGISQATDIAETEVPNGFKLHNNYPNPFNPSTNINFDLYKSGHVSLDVYDILGNRVIELENKHFNPGSYSISWSGINENGEKLAGGVYLIRLKHNNRISIIKSILLK